VVLLYALLFLLQATIFPHGPPEMRPNPEISSFGFRPQSPPRGFNLPSIAPFFIMILFSIVLYLNRKTKQIELDKYQIELHNLKYQLQPHFLFNTLNNLYSISILEPEKTPKYILQLSEILRHILLNDTSEQVTLKDDLKFCREYIALQSLRFEQMDNWNIQFPENTEKLVISPFILIPLIENVFKYGIHPDKPSPIEISLSVEQNTLHLKTWNNKHFSNSNSLLSSEKIGLIKTRERLELIYPGLHKMTILDSEKTFEVQLSIQLKHV
jgi:LytS/YehU family sensor histidine kinase